MDRVQILWVGRIYKGFNDGVKPHSHPFYHMLIIQSGELQVTVNGETFLAKSGDCILFPKESVHSYINLNEEMNESLEIKFSIPANTTASMLSKQNVLRTDQSLAFSLAQRIVREYSDLGGLADDAAASYMSALLNILTEEQRYHKRNDFRFIDATEYTELTQKVIRYLEQHFSEKISLDDLAKKLDYNKSYMCTAFRQNTQITINDCLNMIRIRRAAELIAYSDNDMSKIAKMCGFATVSHFNQVFLRHVGTTPGQCRKAYPQGVTIMPEQRFVQLPNRQDRFMYNVLAQKMITPDMIMNFEKNERKQEN